MSKNLIVVESPAKARTISKYLDKGFKALASYGHVRDLKPKTGAVDPDNQFECRIDPAKCICCNACLAVCPVNRITVQKVTLETAPVKGAGS